MIIEDKCKLPEKEEYTQDAIIPLESYNKQDCTNDDSCIIQPDKQNLFPGHQKIEKKRQQCKHVLNDISNDNILNNQQSNNKLNHCENCKTILDLTNNPTREKFDFKSPYDTTFDCSAYEINNISKDENLCIHCSQYYN